MLRVDHQLTAANRLSGTLFVDRSSTAIPFGGAQIPNWGNKNTTYQQNNVVINDDLVIRPNLISQTRFSYVLNTYGYVGTIHTSWPDWGSKIALGAMPAQPPEITLTSAWNAGTIGSDLMPESTWAASERITWVHGAHNIRAGVGYQWNHFMETATGWEPVRLPSRALSPAIPKPIFNWGWPPLSGRTMV